MQITDLKNIPLVKLKGIGEKSAVPFTKVGVENLYDLLYYYPRTYQTYTEPVKISELYEGYTGAIRVGVCNDYYQKDIKGKTITTVSVADDTGKIGLTFFHLKYLRQVLKPGCIFCFYGTVSKRGNKLHMDQPQIIKPEDYEVLMQALQPVYSLSKGLTSNAIKKAVKQTFEDYGEFAETYAEAFREKYGLEHLKEALINVHLPQNYDKLVYARKRLVFDEFYTFLKALKASKEENNRVVSNFPMIENAYTARFLEKLPFTLTDAQTRAWRDICEDMTSGYVMNRLVQGDVGAGKTIIAFMAMLLCVSNGFQCSFMAPTEVLAGQHYKSLKKLIDQYDLPMHPVLLTGSTSAAEKRRIYEQILSGEIDTVIGTHAVFQEKVVFERLALVITDEQHRFGVRQREKLEEKGDKVHVLVMSATPIPRTLASVLYTDLSVSVVDELPKNRLPIKNCVVGTDKRDVAYRFLMKEVDSGHQAYVICPMVEASEEAGNLENVVDYADKLREVMPESYRIGVLHGQMKPADKNKIMNEFSRGNIDILVSTTVIEVGIDVPNATAIMIENAERFGLAQLHQLRGRVGRGDAQSYCVFIQGNKEQRQSERLEVLVKSNDGFFIANEDLRLRGPGDLFGIRQSGLMQFAMGDIYQDADILMLARDAVEKEGI